MNAGAKLATVCVAGAMLASGCGQGNPPKQGESQAQSAAVAKTAVTKPSAPHDETIKVKGFFLGMAIEDAQALVNQRMGLKPVSSVAKEDDSAMSKAKDSSDPNAAVAAAMLQALGAQVKGMSPEQLKAQGLDDKQIAALGISDDNASYQVLVKKGTKVVARNPQERPIAVADASGKVTSLEFNHTVIAKLFDAADMPKKEFLQTFINSYDIPEMEPEQIKINATIMGTTKEIGFQNVLRHRSPKGFEVLYYDEAVITEDGMETFANTPPEGTLCIRKIETAKARESKFD